VRTISDSQLLGSIKSQNNQTRVTLKRKSVYDLRASQLIKETQKGNFTKVKELIDQGVNIDSHDWHENTPLTDAADRGDLRGVKELLNLGANPYASCDCPDHNTALHYAAIKGHLQIVEFLLCYGVDPNVMNGKSKTPLELATSLETKRVLNARGGMIPIVIVKKFNENDSWSLIKNKNKINEKNILLLEKK